MQSYIYELPFGKGKSLLQNGLGSYVLDGWQVSGVMTLQSGLPINFTYGAGQLRAPHSGNSPNLIAPVQILKGIDNAFWLDPASFSAPGAGQFGNVGRFTTTGPGLFNLDASLFRKFRIPSGSAWSSVARRLA